jgi:ATP-dependent Clp protease ATP-binding subunit ClpA
MRILVALSAPAASAAAGAFALLLVTAAFGVPNVALAVGFFVAFFVGAGIDVLLHERASHERGAWQMRSFGSPTAVFRGGASRQWRSGPGSVVESPPSGPMGPFDRFNDRAKRVLALAQDEAIRLNHNYIGTEHLLLGLVREGEGVAARALDALGIELSKIRRAVELIIGRGESTTSPAEITLSPRTKKVIELAIDESRRLGHTHVGTEHLLLGLVREGEGIASGVLQSFGVPLDRLRQQVMATLAQPGVDPGPPTPEPPPKIPLDRLSEHAKRILPNALHEAASRKMEFAGTQHLLLALARDGTGAAARALAEAGAGAERLTNAVDLMSEGGETASRRVVWSPRAIAVFEIAVREAGADKLAGTGHLLLAVLEAGDGMAPGILASLGVQRESLEQSVRARIAEGLP